MLLTSPLMTRDISNMFESTVRLEAFQILFESSQTGGSLNQVRLEAFQTVFELTVMLGWSLPPLSSRCLHQQRLDADKCTAPQPTMLLC